MAHTPKTSTMIAQSPEKKRKINEQCDNVKVITPSPKKKASSLNSIVEMESSANDSLVSRLDFSQSASTVQENTRTVYTLVQKMTGNIGGNGHGGAIYGELTMGSMQRLVDLMKNYTGLGKDSRFIDVGCGLGKPNLHVAQDPGVSFSYGIEMEHVRWTLGLANMNQVLDAAHDQQMAATGNSKPSMPIRCKCILEWGDVTSAKSFDPFTHVYMFDVGFPPKLFDNLALMFNRSLSPYLICFHSPKLMVEKYGFQVELIVKASTSMHGSSEGHTAYIYRRRSSKNHKISTYEDVVCDPRFSDAFALVKQSDEHIRTVVKRQLQENLSSARSTRSRS